jgi:hypothetical protein
MVWKLAADSSVAPIARDRQHQPMSKIAPRRAELIMVGGPIPLERFKGAGAENAIARARSPANDLTPRSTTGPVSRFLAIVFDTLSGLSISA